MLWMTSLLELEEITLMIPFPFFRIDVTTNNYSQDIEAISHCRSFWTEGRGEYGYFRPCTTKYSMYSVILSIPKDLTLFLQICLLQLCFDNIIKMSSNVHIFMPVGASRARITYSNRKERERSVISLQLNIVQTKIFINNKTIYYRYL